MLPIALDVDADADAAAKDAVCALEPYDGENMPMPEPADRVGTEGTAKKEVPWLLLLLSARPDG